MRGQTVAKAVGATVLGIYLGCVVYVFGIHTLLLLGGICLWIYLGGFVASNLNNKDRIKWNIFKL